MNTQTTPSVHFYIGFGTGNNKSISLSGLDRQLRIKIYDRWLNNLYWKSCYLRDYIFTFLYNNLHPVKGPIVTQGRVLLYCVV